MTPKSSDQLLESLSALVDNEASELEVRRILKNVDVNPEVRDRWRSYNLIGSVMRKEVDANLGGTLRAGKKLNIAERVAVAVQQEQTFSEHVLPRESVAMAGANALQPGAVAKSKGLVDFIAKSAVAASFAGALVVGFNLLSPGNNSATIQSPGQLAAAVRPQNVVDPDLTAPVGFELPRLESRTVSSAGTVNPLLNTASSPTRLQVFDPAQMDDLSDPATQRLLNELLIHHAARASANGSLGLMPYARVSQMRQVGTSE